MENIIQGFKAFAYTIFFIVSVSVLAFNYSGGQFLNVETGSMTPTIPQNSLVMILPQKNLSTGDIATYVNTSGVNVTHRVVGQSIGGDYIFRGDTNQVDDKLPVKREAIVGKYLTHIPMMGKIGAYPLILFPLALIAITELISALFKRKLKTDEN